MDKERVIQAVETAEEVLMGLIIRINKENGRNTGFVTPHDKGENFIIAVATLASGILAAE